MFDARDIQLLGVGYLFQLYRLLPNERVLLQNNVFYISESIVNTRFDVYIDYIFKNEKLSPRPPVQVLTSSLLLRRILDINRAAGYAQAIPICLNQPINRELEIQAFSRAYLKELDSRNSVYRRISLLLLIFIDGFGLYRNAYRTLIGFYFIPVGLLFIERNRRANVFLFILGLYSSNFADVVEAIKSLAILDCRVDVNIPAIGKVRLVVFTFAYIGNMPQQQKNLGIKTQQANLGCRLCYVPIEERGLLDYNTFTNRRYYRTVLAMREDIDNLPTNAVRQAYGVTQSIDPDPSSIALSKILLALNIVLSRLGDPAHLEY